MIPRLLRSPRTTAQETAIEGSSQDEQEEQDIDHEGQPFPITSLETTEKQDHAAAEDSTSEYLAEQVTPAQSEHEEEQQPAAQITFARFHDEAEEDYTSGPCRFTVASDGIQDCAALLMKMDLTAKIREAIQFQRRLVAEQAYMQRQDAENDSFHVEVTNEIFNYKIRVARAQQEYEDATHQHDEEEMQSLAHTLSSLNEKLEVLKAIEEDVADRRPRMENNIAWQKEMFLESQQELWEYFEEVFVTANLIEPMDSENERPVETLDLQVEYQKAMRRAQQDENECTPQTPVSPEPLETGDDFMGPQVPSLSPEEQAEEDIRTAVFQAQGRVNNAQYQFNLREQEREQELLYNQRAVQEDLEPLDAGQTEFDLRWVQRNREITHELVEAEKELFEAKAAAKAANIDPYDRESCYDDNTSEVSFAIDTQNAAAYVAPRVNEWLEGIAEDANSEAQSSTDTEDWHLREVEMWDSISCVDFDFYREQIDRWQQVCQAEKL